MRSNNNNKQCWKWFKWLNFQQHYESQAVCVQYFVACAWSAQVRCAANYFSCLELDKRKASQKIVKHQCRFNTSPNKIRSPTWIWQGLIGSILSWSFFHLERFNANVIVQTWRWLSHTGQQLATHWSVLEFCKSTRFLKAFWKSHVWTNPRCVNLHDTFLY